MFGNPGSAVRRSSARRSAKIRDLRAMTAGRRSISRSTAASVRCRGRTCRRGANALVAGSAVFKGGTMEAYKANIAAIRNGRHWRAAKRSSRNKLPVRRMRVASSGELCASQ